METNEISERELKYLPISRIRENPVALRSVDTDSESFKGLRDSIALKGVINPIAVHEVQVVDETQQPVIGDDGQPVMVFEVIDGLHRYTAAKDAGLQSVPCHIMTGNEKSILEDQIMGNVHKIETKSAEYAKQLLRLMTMNPSLTVSQLATSLGKSVQWLNNTLSLTKLSSKIQNLVNSGDIKLMNAYALARLPEEEQDNFINNAMTTDGGEFANQIAARLKEVRDERRKGNTPKPAEFTPMPAYRKISDIKDENIRVSNAVAVVKKAGANTIEEVVAITLRWILQIDDESIATQKAKWDARAAAAQEAKDKAKAEREARAAAKAGKAAEAAEVAA